MILNRKIHCSGDFPKLKYLLERDISKNRVNNSETKINNILDNNILKNYVYNLISPGDGYLYDIYNIKSESVEWLTGWEIAKIIYSKECTDNNDEKFNLKIYSYFANNDNDFMSGFMAYITSLKKSKLKHYCFIYNPDSNAGTIDINSVMNMKINYINTIDYEETTYNSSNMCRYVNNYLRKYISYLNYVVIHNDNVNITNFMHTLMNINKDFGLLIISIPWLNVNDESMYLYVYILSCIFANIQLSWYLWDNKIWISCSNINETFTKEKWINIINSDGFCYEKIYENYSEDYDKIKNDILLFYEDIISIKDKNICHAIHIDKIDSENIIQKWLKDNEKELETFILNK